jgi:aryl-alcohol dehydrogenase-like predicted oxidoreductase
MAVASDAPRYWKGLDRSVAPLGFGCWQLAGEYTLNGKPHGWGAMDQRSAVALIHAALDQGVEFFDTAAGYGTGRSEELLGKGLATSANTNAAVVCTKQALLPEEIASMAIGAAFKERVEHSLARLGVSRIDVLLLHSPPDQMDWLNFDVSALDQLVREGKVGTYGVSSISLPGARKVIEVGFGTCVEWVFHLFERRPVDTLFPEIMRSGMNFIARSPLSRGLISPRYISQQPVFAADHFRSTLPPDWVEWTIDQLRRLNEQEDLIAQSAIRYCLSYPEMSVVIPGYRNEDQLASAMAAWKAGGLTAEHTANLLKNIDTHYPPWS